MSVTALEMQHEIQGAMRKVERDLGTFASCLEKAKAETSSEAKQNCLEELRTLNEKLQKHRDHIRHLTTQAGVRKVKRNGLADARQRLETEMRKFQEFVASADAKSVPKSPSGSVHSADGSTQSPDSDMSSDSFETKIMVEQLLDDGTDNEVVDEFKCKVCMVHVVGCGPMLTKCSHLFCGDCIAQWFAMNPGNKTWAQRAKSGGTVPCPVCKEPLMKDQDLHPVCRDGDGGSKFLYHMLSKTRVMCANNPKCRSDGKCTWVGDYGSFQEHIRTCKNEPEPSPAVLEEGTAVEVEEPMQSDPEQSHSDVLDNSSPSNTKDLQTEDAVTLIDEIASEPATVQQDSDEHLTGLIDQLLQIKRTERTDSEDLCSTHDSEASACVETSDASSEQDGPSETPDVQTMMPMTDVPEDLPMLGNAKHSDCQGQSRMSPGAMKAYQAAVQQWQMHQYQAAQYKAAQWQMAQWQMAHWQQAQAQAMQWQMAQRYQQQQQQQQQAHNAARDKRR